MNNEQSQLMKRLQIASFCMLDTVLFLDTHPEDKSALDAYARYRDTKMILEKEYIAKYGPLSINNAAGPDGWGWANAPWPWELEA